MSSTSHRQPTKIYRIRIRSRTLADLVPKLVCDNLLTLHVGVSTYKGANLTESGYIACTHFCVQVHGVACNIALPTARD